MRKLFLILMLLISTVTYAQMWEGNGGNWLDENLTTSSAAKSEDGYDPDLNYYLCQFIKDEEVIKKRMLTEGMTIIPPSADETKKTGYSLAGWSPELDATMPASNRVYTALYDINYWTLTLYDDSGTISNSYAYGSDLSSIEPTPRTGYMAWWEPSLPETMPDNDFASVAQYSNNVHIVTTIVEGISTQISVPYGADISAFIPVPSKDGYAFTGWEPSLPNTMPDSDLSVTAQFSPTKYTVTYLNPDQSVYATQVYDWKEEIVEPNEPSYNGKRFWDWKCVDYANSDNLPDEMPPATFTVVAQVFPESTKAYGMTIDLTQSTMDTACTYIYDAVGKSSIQIQSDGSFTGLEDNDNTWRTFIYDNVKPCMLKYDGTVDYYLDPENQTLKEDGTPSDIGNLQYEGNAMVEFKKLWSNAKRIKGTSTYKIIFSENEIPNITYAEAFRRDDGTYADKAYFAMFPSVLDSGKHRSLSVSGSIYPTGTDNFSYYVQYAEANGENWGISYESLYQHITKMLLLVGRTMNPEGTFYESKHVNLYASTKSNLNNVSEDKGAFYVQGNYSSQGYVKTLWISEFWGKAYFQTQGMFYHKGNLYLKTNPGFIFRNSIGYKTIDTSNSQYNELINYQIYATRLSFLKGIGYFSKFSRYSSDVVINSGLRRNTSDYGWFGISTGASYRINSNYYFYANHGTPIKRDRMSDPVSHFTFVHFGWDRESTPVASVWTSRLTYVDAPKPALGRMLMKSNARNIVVEESAPIVEYATPTAELEGVNNEADN